ncbi:predicted protein [Postia placenta Mad-698-R]|nr:predicted protein [Postia placenta Mad-698-R]
MTRLTTEWIRFSIVIDGLDECDPVVCQDGDVIDRLCQLGKPGISTLAQEILGASSNMFLYIRIWVDKLYKMCYHSTHDVMEALETPPHDLDVMYEDYLSELFTMNASAGRSNEIAIRCIPPGTSTQSPNTSISPSTLFDTFDSIEPRGMPSTTATGPKWPYVIDIQALLQADRKAFRTDARSYETSGGDVPVAQSGHCLDVVWLTIQFLIFVP